MEKEFFEILENNLIKGVQKILMDSGIAASEQQAKNVFYKLCAHIIQTKWGVN